MLLAITGMQFFNNKGILPPEIQGLVTIVFLALTLTFFYYMMIKTVPKKQEEQYITKTLIKCMNSEHTEERRFEKGDYIGKIVGECPEGDTKYIYAIYDVSLAPKKTQ